MEINARMMRNNAIDFLRGFSIISVILLHCYIHLPFPDNFLNETVTNRIFRSGYYGVMIFFVISGFLITSTSLNRWERLSNINIFEFYKIRFARIVPCLLGIILILSLLDIAGVKGFVISNTTLSTTIFSALTFHINWLEAKVGYLPGGWDVLWSLSVEEVFYLVFPFICILTRSRIAFILTMLIFIILGPLARSFTTNDMWSDHSYLSCMDGIAIGCLVAVFLPKIKKSGLYLIMGLLLFSFIFLFRHTAYILGVTSLGLNVTFLEVGVALMLISMTQQPRLQKLKFGSIIQQFGKNSYEIYLTHVVLVILIVNFFHVLGLSNPWIFVFYALILLSSLWAGQLVSKYYSMPMNRVLRLKPKRQIASFNNG